MPEPNRQSVPPKGEVKRRLHRLEELRRDLSLKNESRRQYALDTLLAQLWVRVGAERMEVVRTLLDGSVLTNPAESSVCAERLCSRLNQPESDIALSRMLPLEARKAWLGQAVNAVLNHALDTLKAGLRMGADVSAPSIRQEMEVCQETLKLAQMLCLSEAAEPCVRILRLFTAELERTGEVAARPTRVLREAASQTLGLLSPDTLFTFWYILGSPDPRPRSDLLPVLDYLHDARAVPYLIRLLERRGQWSDGNLVGWYVVRAFERIGDRRAVAVLRQMALEEQSVEGTPGIGIRQTGSIELAREARRVLQSLESGRAARDREHLLRPSEPPSDHLLQPAEVPEPSQQAGTLLRSSDSDSPTLLRAAAQDGTALLRPVQPTALDTEKEAQELVRPAE